MKCNDARTLANRENAKKSTGPRTEEGKARSRTNALKHGLAGKGVAWPEEVEGEMQRFIEGQVADEPIQPRDRRERVLVEKVAKISWMLDRAERAEEAQAIVRASEAEGVLRKKRKAEVAELVRQLPDDPGGSMEELLETTRGCRWVIDAIREMIDAVDTDWWLCSLDDRLDAICAPAQPGRLRISRAKAIALALGSGNYEAIWPNGVPGLEELEPGHGLEDTRAWMRRRAEIVREMRPKWQGELKAILARRLAEVERRLAELEARPDPALKLAAIVATFDLTEYPERLRRYIRSRERERRLLLEELETYRARRDENPIERLPEPEEEPEPAPEPPAPLTPFEDRPDAELNPRGHGLNGPDFTERWVRSGKPQFDEFGRRCDEVEPDETPRK